MQGQSVVTDLATYAERVGDEPLPAHVARAAGDHLLDTVAAIVSGSPLPAGARGRDFAKQFGGDPRSLILGTSLRTDPASAAMANGMAAHADETDDSHEPSRTHPGCAVVPAALAMAEHVGVSGEVLLHAIAFGYDVCARITRALWPDFTVLRSTSHSTHAIGGLFGATMAAGVVASLPSAGFPVALSYACHRASGTTMWMRDTEHVQKAFVFGGMPASAGTQIALMVAAGWTGVEDPFTGSPGFLDVFGTDSDAALLTEGLGERFAIEETNMKWLPVGSPIQAPAQALLELLDRPELANKDIASVEVSLPSSLAEVVTDRHMPAIDIEYVLSLILTDRSVSFATVHDEERFASWRRQVGDKRVSISADSRMAAVRQARVVVTAADGQRLERHVDRIHGSAGDPMSSEEVDSKASALLGPVVGQDRAAQVIESVRSIVRRDVRELASLVDV